MPSSTSTTPLDAEFPREIGVRGEVHRLAMDGNRDPRPEPAVHLAHFVAARMAGDVDEPLAVGDDP